MIALIVIGAIWAAVFVIISLVGLFVLGTPSIHTVSESIWFLVVSLPGFITMFSGIVGRVLSSKLKSVESKFEEPKADLKGE
ncbi:hypothetical protein KAX06_05515 [candidate division WOR-3 bacterium]|nr:hypothetical protein [candidate division WOR-3 bacterium]